MDAVRVLITGATGYIGGRLAPRLVEEGHRVRVVVRSPEKLRDVPWHDSVEIKRGDLTDSATLSGVFDDIDVVYYLVHAMGGGRVVLGYRQAKRGERRRRCPRCGGATDRLPGRASSVRPRVVDSLAVPARSRSDPARLRGSDGCVPSWSGDRIGFGVLRNGAPLDQSTSGDDHTQVGAQQHSADRSA